MNAVRAIAIVSEAGKGCFGLLNFRFRSGQCQSRPPCFLRDPSAYASAEKVMCDVTSSSNKGSGSGSDKNNIGRRAWPGQGVNFDRCFALFEFSNAGPTGVHRGCDMSTRVQHRVGPSGSSS